MNCMQWLRYCLSVGWPRSDLKGLADLYWKYHPQANTACDGTK